MRNTNSHKNIEVEQHQTWSVFGWVTPAVITYIQLISPIHKNIQRTVKGLNFDRGTLP